MYEVHPIGPGLLAHLHPTPISKIAYGAKAHAAQASSKPTAYNGSGVPGPFKVVQLRLRYRPETLTEYRHQAIDHQPLDGGSDAEPEF